jgi:hypothetical protein
VRSTSYGAHSILVRRFTTIDSTPSFSVESRKHSVHTYVAVGYVLAMLMWCCCNGLSIRAPKYPGGKRTVLSRATLPHPHPVFTLACRPWSKPHLQLDEQYEVCAMTTVCFVRGHATPS